MTLEIVAALAKVVPVAVQTVAAILPRWPGLGRSRHGSGKICGRRGLGDEMVAMVSRTPGCICQGRARRSRRLWPRRPVSLPSCPEVLVALPVTVRGHSWR